MPINIKQKYLRGNLLRVSLIIFHISNLNKDHVASQCVMTVADGYIGMYYHFSLTSVNRNELVVELFTRCEKRKRGKYWLRIGGADFGFPGGTTHKRNYCNAVVYPNAVCTLAFILTISYVAELLPTGDYSSYGNIKFESSHKTRALLPIITNSTAYAGKVYTNLEIMD
jgi:hypothetical protein